LRTTARRRKNWFVPSTLRARLTLSYATLTAGLLVLVFCGLVALGLQRYIRSTMLSIDEVAVSTRQIVTYHWGEPDTKLILRVLQQPRSAGVRLVARPQRPPGFSAPPRADGQRPPGPPGGFRPGGGPPPERSLSAIFGLHTRFIPLHQGVVIIGPTIRIENLLEIGATAFAISIAVTIFVAWSIGHWITRQAIVPLTAVTRELRRFAAGDFVPSTLETRDESELGELVDAFNAAAVQVVAAFSERERTEQHLRLFLGEAGHEMRTPLTVISAYLEVLDAGGPDGASMSPEMLQTLRTETRRLRSLVERVMSLARMEGGDRSRSELVDVAEVAADAIAHVTTAQGGDVRLTNTAGDVVVLAEPWALQEAIGNLVDNAVRYGGGTPVHVSIAEEDGDIVVRVSDGGPGVSDVERGQLFGHFFRGEQAAGKAGSGLGLAIVARAAARLGGDVTLESSVPQRTVFRLTVPRYHSHEPQNGEVRLV
jgi:two-component system OmpR family sensor kinase